MYSSASGGVQHDNIHHVEPKHNPPSKCNTYGFAIAIIFGIIGVSGGVTGLCGYLQIGALSQMAQVDAIITMSVSGVLFLIGVVGIVKNRQSQNAHVDYKHSTSTRKSVYGPEVWPELGKKWGYKLEIVDEIPEAPKDKVADGRIRIYIPHRIKVNGEEKGFTLKTLKEISGESFGFLSDSVRDEYGDDTAPGWIDIDRQMDPESLGKNYATLERRVKEKGCHMPAAIQAAALNLIVFALTGERLFTSVYTHCNRKVEGKYPIIVGGFGSDGLYVYYSHFDDDDFAHDNYGIAAFRKF